MTLGTCLALAVAVSAAPLNGIVELRKRDQSSSSSNGSLSMSVWLPIFIVTIIFVLFSFCTCVRRCAANEAAASTTGTRPANTPANGTNSTRPSRRAQRTLSQISTKSLPPYMKEPGEQELVLFRGPDDSDDEHPHAMPALAEEDEEPQNQTFDIPLNRTASVDTMEDSSTTNLIRRASQSIPRPPELHHATMPRGHHRTGDALSLDSTGSEAELLTGHRRGISVDSYSDPRGEAPSYTEVTNGSTLNDPATTSEPVVPPPSLTADAAAGRARSRFHFHVQNPFSSHNNAPSNGSSPPTSTRSASPAQQTGTTLTRYSTHDSQESNHSRTPSRSNPARMHAHSNSSLFRAFRSHSPGLPAGSSTISLDSISAPLTHTVTRAEFHAPKGGMLTPEQVKLITSRAALEKFGVPYGPDAVAAYSLSRERVAAMGSPPDFESVTGHEERTSGNSATVAVMGTTAQTPDITEDQPRSTSLPPSLSLRSDVRAASPARTDTSHESDEEGQPLQAQSVQVHSSDDEDGFLTARPERQVRYSWE